jgi:hypothetical protein
LLYFVALTITKLLGKPMKRITILASLLMAATAPAAHAKAGLATLLCPQKQMSIGDFTQLGLPLMPRATPLAAAEAAKLNRQFAAVLKACGKQSGWSKAQADMARQFAISDAAYELMDMRFITRGVRRDDVVLNINKLSDVQKKSIADGTMQQSGALDAVIADLKSRKIRMDFNDTNTRQDIQALFAIASGRFAILGKFTQG